MDGDLTDGYLSMERDSTLASYNSSVYSVSLQGNGELIMENQQAYIRNEHGELINVVFNVLQEDPNTDEQQMILSDDDSNEFHPSNIKSKNFGEVSLEKADSNHNMKEMMAEDTSANTISESCKLKQSISHTEVVTEGAVSLEIDRENRGCSNVVTEGTVSLEIDRENRGCSNSMISEAELNNEIDTDDPSQLHVCPRCKAFFSTSHYLKQHMRRQCLKPSEQDKPFKCEYCSNSFRMRHQLSRHMMQHTGERPHKCEVCTKTFLSKSHLKRHAVIHKSLVNNDKDVFKCNTCEKVFAWSASLDSHMKIHSGEKRFKCGICGRMFLHLGSLRSHMTNRHTVNGKFTCVVCKETFKEATELILHMKSHNEQESVKCERCYAFFTSLNDLETHICSNFGGKPLICILCLKEFADTNTYCNHSCMSVSTARRCGCCGKHLKSIWHLREHLITHTGEKPFLCSKCHKKFRRQRELNIHLTRHSSIKLFSCPHCESSFTSEHYMKQHMRKNHREKKFVCHVCNHAFMHKCTLINHMVYHTKTGNNKFGKKYHRGDEMLIPELVAKRLEKQMEASKDISMSQNKQSMSETNLCKMDQDVKVLLDCAVTKVEQVCHEMERTVLMNDNATYQNKNGKLEATESVLLNIKEKNADSIYPLSHENISLPNSTLQNSSKLMIGSLNQSSSKITDMTQMKLPQQYAIDIRPLEDISMLSSNITLIKPPDMSGTIVEKDLQAFKFHQITKHDKFTDIDGINACRKKNEADEAGVLLSQVIEPKVSLRNAEQDPGNITTIYQTDLNGSLTVRCATCFRDFSSHGELLRHRKEVHDDGKPYQCDICTKTFTIAANLSTHRNIHSIKQKFSCSHCGKSYKVVHALREHLLNKHHANTDNLTDLELTQILDKGVPKTLFQEISNPENVNEDLCYKTDSMVANEVRLPLDYQNNPFSEESNQSLTNIVFMNSNGTATSCVSTQELSKREDLSFLVNLSSFITHFGGMSNSQKTLIRQENTDQS